MKEFILTLYRFTLKLTNIAFWIFSAIMIVIILFTDMEGGAKISFLAFTMVGLALCFGVIRFLKYMFSK
jgi:hypothetical protein